MRFYNRQHTYYCGIDLHVKTMYVCILDGAGQVLVHRNVSSTPAAFLDVVAPYRAELVVAAECMLAGRRREARHLCSDAALSPDGRPSSSPSTEMSSSSSGQ